MPKSARIVTDTAEDVRARLAGGEDRTDWARVKAMPQAEVERLAEEEDGPLPDGCEGTVQDGLPPRKQAVHMRLDTDVLDWFRARGPGYQTRINAALRAFIEARQRSEGRQK